MSSSDSTLPLDSFVTFGDLLKYLRRRAQLTQRELSIAVGYSEAQISRLEQNQRPPDLATLMALLIPALQLEDDPVSVTRLMELAAHARGEELPRGGVVTFSRSVQRQEGEMVRTVEESVQNNLPLQLTSFIGREHVLSEIKNLLDPVHGKNRLVTLTGSGGCGKTRLSLEVARQLAENYRDGVWFIELASISDPALVLQAVTVTLGIHEAQGDSLRNALSKYLGAKQSLLIFDNCEQIISSASRLAEEILRTCPQVYIIATSREILNIPGEVRFRVPSLATPQDDSLTDNVSAQFESVKLFVERAQTILPSFILSKDNIFAVTQICKRVDGMPLAIELAAARTAVLSVEQIATRLDNSFQLLTGGRKGIPRQETLQATIAWSYDLLSDPERMLLQRLSVFSGGWYLDAAEAIANDSSNILKENILDLLSQLVNKSLVLVELQLKSEARYTLLQTIHEFAREKLLASGELESMRARHFDYFFRTAQRGEENLFAVESSLDWAETEIDNLRTALAWALEPEADGSASDERTGPALDMMLHVWPLWLNRGYSSEGSEWLNRLLAVHTAASPARARGLLLAADFVGFRGDTSGKATMIREALTLARALGDKRRTAMALMEMGLVERDYDHYSEAVQFLTESWLIFQKLNESLWVYRTSFLLAETYMANGDFEAARPLWSQGLELCRAKNDRFHTAWGLEGLGSLERLEGHVEQASQLYAASLQIKVDVMDKMGIMYSLASFAQLAAAQKQFKRAAILWGAMEQLGESMNMLLSESTLLYTSLIPDTRAFLGTATFESAWAQGRVMQMRQTIEYALTFADE